MQVLFVPIPGYIGYIRAGKLRALAVTTATRSEALSDIPTVGEFVPSYEASLWLGIGAPNKTHAEIIDKLNKEVNAGLADAQGAPRTRRCADVDDARRLRQIHRCRNREVGEGGPDGQHKAGVRPAGYSIEPVM